MRFKLLAKKWDKFAEIDPLWSILSWNDKRNNQWESDDFFHTGKIEINELIKEIKSLDLKLNYIKAVDFGCGVGRLTLPLAKYFNTVFGVDVSSKMINLANRYKNTNKSHYILNQENNLKIFNDNSIDFVYSNITLQHMKPKYTKKYIKEFIRITKPDGLIVFQLASDPKENTAGVITILKRKIKKIIPYGILDFYRRRKENKEIIMDMYGIKKDCINKIVKKQGATIIKIVKNDSAGKEWNSYKYFIKKLCIS